MAPSLRLLSAIAGALGVFSADPVHPACFDITCADIDCKAPFELVRRDGQCC
eukprot:CAMPEP_0197899938 /NCGR_PEP_ID=MMETSP1439-20131203/47787_1 /TAXON_ID=66791 /ORGANISM="Gonyaulax spinifera, Strain CCMP409" /LENGTH=51 /DNA_ID=CAMNT_0043520781 /DNA_START=71 /DNA_END=223 /DNA_ORIENTATION=+